MIQFVPHSKHTPCRLQKPVTQCREITAVCYKNDTIEVIQPGSITCNVLLLNLVVRKKQLNCRSLRSKTVLLWNVTQLCTDVSEEANAFFSGSFSYLTTQLRKIYKVVQILTGKNCDLFTHK
jgi:hypothetical protein